MPFYGQKGNLKGRGQGLSKCLEEIMIETLVDEGRLRKLFKEAFVETLEEKKDVLYNLLVEVIEDIALVRAIQEGENTESVSRQNIFNLLETQA